MISMGRGDPDVVAGIKCQDSRPCSHANQEVPAPEASLHNRFPPQEVYWRARSCSTSTHRKLLPVGAGLSTHQRRPVVKDLRVETSRASMPFFTEHLLFPPCLLSPVLFPSCSFLLWQRLAPTPWCRVRCPPLQEAQRHTRQRRQRLSGKGLAGCRRPLTHVTRIARETRQEQCQRPDGRADFFSTHY